MTQTSSQYSILPGSRGLVRVGRRLSPESVLFPRTLLCEATGRRNMPGKGGSTDQKKMFQGTVRLSRGRKRENQVKNKMRDTGKVESRDIGRQTADDCCPGPVRRLLEANKFPFSLLLSFWLDFCYLLIIQGALDSYHTVSDLRIMFLD